MKDKINVAELLKYCPCGMELDCTMWDNLYFDRVEDDLIHCYYELDGFRNATMFLKDGCYTAHKLSKCVIFPKGKTTWEGFVPPCKFKDGDIVATDTGLQVFILQKATSDAKGYCYIGYDFEFNEVFDTGEWVFDRLATEEEKEKLFKAIKKYGYKHNNETNFFKNLFTVTYNIGTKVWVKSDKEHNYIHTIVGISRNSFGNLEYEVKEEKTGVIVHYPEDSLIPLIPITLVPDKFNINTLIPFESKVLVRGCNSHEWEGEIFARYADKSCNNCNFVTLGGLRWKQCIPYNDDTKYLLGKTDNCDEFYITWSNE